MYKIQPVATGKKNTIRKEEVQGTRYSTLHTKEEKTMIQNTRKKRNLPRDKKYIKLKRTQTVVRSQRVAAEVHAYREKIER